MEQCIKKEINDIIFKYQVSKFNRSSRNKRLDFFYYYFSSLVICLQDKDLEKAYHLIIKP